LKKQVTELREEIRQKNEDLENFKKNVRFSKYQELEVELKAHIDENIRLRTLLEESYKERPRLY